MLREISLACMVAKVDTFTGAQIMKRIFAALLMFVSASSAAQNLPPNFKQVTLHHWSAGHFDTVEQIYAVAGCH
jgi:hypothetical protein